MKAVRLLFVFLFYSAFFVSCENINSKSDQGKQTTKQYLEENFIGNWKLDSSQFNFTWINHSGISSQWEIFEVQKFDGHYLVHKYNATYYLRHWESDNTSYLYVSDDSTFYDSIPFSLKVNFLESGYIEVYETKNGAEIKYIANELWSYVENTYTEGLEEKKELFVNFSLIYPTSLKSLSWDYTNTMRYYYTIHEEEIDVHKIKLSNTDNECNAYFYFSKK